MVALMRMRRVYCGAPAHRRRWLDPRVVTVAMCVRRGIMSKT